MKSKHSSNGQVTSTQNKNGRPKVTQETSAPQSRNTSQLKGTRSSNTTYSTTSDPTFQFIQWACQAILDEGQNDNPLKPALLENQIAYRYSLEHRPLAKLILKYIQTNAVEKNEPGPLSVSDYVISRFYALGLACQVHLNTENKSVTSFGVPVVIYEFFNDQKKALSKALHQACRLVHMGMPLYEPEKNKDSYKRIGYTDRNYVFIFIRGSHDTIDEVNNIPSWVNNLYFHNEHINTLYRYFPQGPDTPLSIKTKDLLRAKFRRQLGIDFVDIDDPDFKTTEHKTKLFDLLPQVIKRYYSDNFDINDPNTHTSQTVVMRWIQENNDISDNEAKCIDIVTRPDKLRRK